MITAQSRTYQSTFEEIASALPELLKQLKAPEKRFGLKSYLAKGSGEKTAFQALKAAGFLPPETKSSAFPGIYLLFHDGTPFYVGISRNVLNRLKQHVTGKSHYSASLAYKLAKDRIPDFTGKRSEMDISFINKAQVYMLEHCKASVLPIYNTEQLYLLELYTAMQLKTPYNTFETH
jgi:hypothetical protein